MRRPLDDLRSAARALRRRPGFTAGVALVLAAGIGAGTGVFSVVSAVLLTPLPVPAADRLALVWNGSAAGEETWLSLPEIEDLRQRSRAFDGIAALRDQSFNVTGEGEPEAVPAAAVSADLFPLAGVEPALGRAFLPADDQEGAERVAMLSHGFWRRRFGGDPLAVGRLLQLDGEPHRIVGVLPEGFRILPPSSVFPPSVEVWVPLEPVLSDLLRQRDVHHLHALARLAPGATVEAANAELATLSRGLAAEHPGVYDESGWRLAAVGFREQVVRGARPALVALSGAVALLLLLVCANVAGLLLAQHGARSRELAVRAALGAGRGRLFAQLVAESLLLAVLGGAGGVWLAALAVDLLPALAPDGLPRLDEVAIDGRALAFALAAAALAVILAGIAPAARAASTALGGPMREGTSGSARAGRARRLLVAAEIALALVLAVGTGLLAESWLRLAAEPTGFTAEDVLTVKLTLAAARYPDAGRRAAFLSALTERVAALPGVRAAGAVSHLPFSGAVLGSGFQAVGGSGETVDADLRGVTPGYLEALGIPLVAGRPLAEADGPHAEPVAVIDRTLAARLWPGEDPARVVGRRLLWIRSEVPLTVVGVAGAVRHEGPETPPRETVYRPYAQYARATTVFVTLRAATAPAALAAALRREVAALDPEQPVAEVLAMAERVEAATGRPRFQALLVALFATLAVMLAACGVYGVVAYAVARRTREMGVRLALGAAPGDLLRLVLGEGLLLAALGVAAGLALALAAARLLAGTLPGVPPGATWTFAGAALLLGVVALAACAVPALRAARVDPTVALRAEP